MQLWQGHYILTSLVICKHLFSATCKQSIYNTPGQTVPVEDIPVIIDYLSKQCSVAQYKQDKQSNRADFNVGFILLIYIFFLPSTRVLILLTDTWFVRRLTGYSLTTLILTYYDIVEVIQKWYRHI